MFYILENNNSLTSLDLKNNKIGYIDVFEILENNSSLTFLDLSDNIYNIDTFEKIFIDILHKNTTLTDLLYDSDNNDYNDYDDYDDY